MGLDFAPALYAVWSNPLAGREDELHAWYEDMHIPDSLEAGLFDSVRRYRAIESGAAAYLTLWGCGYRDEEEALRAVRPVAEGLRERGRIEVVQEVVFQQFVFLEETLEARSSESSRFLTTLQNCWAEPESVSMFDERLANNTVRDASHDGPRARYSVMPSTPPSPGSKALLLFEADRENAYALGENAQPGLPPFGAPTPIFVGGSPAPSPTIDDSAGSSPRAAAPAAWAAGWELISER